MPERDSVCWCLLLGDGLDSEGAERDTDSDGRDIDLEIEGEEVSETDCERDCDFDDEEV